MATKPIPRGGDEPRRDFIGFRERLERLVKSLVALRDIPDANSAWTPEPEHVEVTLKADDIEVEFTVDQVSLKNATALVGLFHHTFAGLAPLLVRSASPGFLTFEKASAKDGSWGRLFLGDQTTLGFGKSMGEERYDIKVTAPLADFNDHFESFVMDAARKLYPPIEKPRPQPVDRTDWRDEFGRSFERLGCRVMQESNVGWRDLVGLERVRRRLEHAVLLPLVRRDLYQKIAQAVMPGAINLLPRGVLLIGPPGTGKTWSMRALAGEAELPVVALPCDAVMSKWYGESEQRLAEVFRLCRESGRMILLVDELDSLARHRQSSHEATARLVSILLTEMDGLAGASEVVLVGSANAIESIDKAVLDRFDVTIEFELPDTDQRRSALEYYARHLSPENVADLAGRTEGWNFRRLARFAEAVVRAYVAGLNLSQLEAREPPLPQMDDYLKELAVAR